MTTELSWSDECDADNLHANSTNGGYDPLNPFLHYSNHYNEDRTYDSPPGAAEPCEHDGSGDRWRPVIVTSIFVVMVVLYLGVSRYRILRRERNRVRAKKRANTADTSRALL